MNSPLGGFQLHQLRLVYEVATPLVLQASKGSALRGALFGALRARFCVSPGLNAEADADSPLCAACPGDDTCPISYLMATPNRHDALGRGQELPHPYVVVPPLTSQTTYQPGERLEFGLTLFGAAAHTFPYLLVAAQAMGEQGLGLGHERGRLALREIWQVNPIVGQQMRLFHHQRAMARMPNLAVTAEQVRDFAADLPADDLILHFLTPTRLITEGVLVQSGPPLDVLLHRLLERLWMLAAVYGEQPGSDAANPNSHREALDEWRASWPVLLTAVRQVRGIGNGARWQEMTRYSSRHDRSMPTSGLVGEARYQGDLTELREVLLWGQLCHVGKLAVLGNGMYELDY